MAELLGISEKSYRNKENGLYQFKMEEISIIASIFNLNPEEIKNIFL